MKEIMASSRSRNSLRSSSPGECNGGGRLAPEAQLKWQSHQEELERLRKELSSQKVTPGQSGLPSGGKEAFWQGAVGGLGRGWSFPRILHAPLLTPGTAQVLSAPCPAGLPMSLWLAVQVFWERCFASSCHRCARIPSAWLMHLGVNGGVELCG